MDVMELEARPRRPLMLKEWMELESSAELPREGFGCYPRHLAAELRSASASGRRRNGDVIARFSAAVRAALSRPPARREGEPAALSRSLSRRLRAGFWKKRTGEAEETDDGPVASCSAAAASSGRRDAPSSSPAVSPRHPSWEGRQGGGDGADRLSNGRRSHETAVAVCECATSMCDLDEEREQEQRLSPVSVMDFPIQDGDDGNDHGGSNNGHSEDDDGASPTFERSLANIRRASEQLRQRIRQFEQLAELDTSDVDDATTTAEDTASCCHIEELDSTGIGYDDDDDDGEGGRSLDPPLNTLPEAGSPCAAAAHCCFKKLLEDFFREGLSQSCCTGRSDDPDAERALLETAKAWLDGRHRAPRSDDGKAEVEEIERLGRWRFFREDERELLGSDVEGGIFWSLMEELVDDLV